MARTGESYTTARAQLRSGPEVPEGARAVLQVVANHFGLDLMELSGRDRRPPRPEAREAATFLLVADAGLTTPEVGLLLGGRSPDTVRRSVARVAGRLEGAGTASQLATLRDGIASLLVDPSESGTTVPSWMTAVLDDQGVPDEPRAVRLAELALRLADGKPVAYLPPRLVQLREGVLRAQRLATEPDASAEARAEASRLAEDFDRQLTEGQLDALGPAELLAEWTGGDPALLAAAWLTCNQRQRRNERDAVAATAMRLLSQAGEMITPRAVSPGAGGPG